MEPCKGLTSIATILEILDIKRCCGTCDHEFFGACHNPSFDPDGRRVDPNDSCSEWREAVEVPVGTINLVEGEF